MAVHHGSKPILAFFGIGRVPGLLLLQGFALCWGVIGFYASRMFEQQGRTPALFILPAMGLAAAGGVIGARLMGSLGARLMPSEESFSAGKGDLIGSIGTSVYPISATMGCIHVFDAYGTLHDESARLCPDLTEPIARDESVILVDYDEAADCYRVERSPV